MSFFCINCKANIEPDYKACPFCGEPFALDVEGHVPVSDILRILDERPHALGLVVPGMPSGSPGMENGGREPYDVLLLKRDGETEVFSSHR